MQHPLTRGNDFLMPAASNNSEDEAANGPANAMLGLVSRANFLPSALHRHHQEAAAAAAAAAAAFDRPKFFSPGGGTPSAMASAGEKEFFRLKSQLDSETAHLNGNNKYASNPESGSKPRGNTNSDFDIVKGKTKFYGMPERTELGQS